MSYAKYIKAGAAVFCLICATHCMVPNKFVQNAEVENGHVETVIMRGVALRAYPNVLDMQPNSKVAIRVVSQTDAETSFEVVMNDSASLTLQLHTTPYADTVLGKHGLGVIINNQTTTIAGVKPLATPYKTGEPFLVKLSSDGVFTTVMVGCTTLPSVRRAEPSSEWTLLQAQGAVVRIIDPLVDNEYD